MSDLLTLQETQDFLGGTDTYRQDHLTAWISGLSSYVRRYIDGPIETETVAETLDGTGETTIMLSKRPVLSLTGLAIDGTEIDTDDVSVYPHGELYYSGGFGSERQSVVVTYTAGYGATVPDDLKLACLLILEQASQSSLLQQSTRGEYAYVFAPTKWPKDAREIIDSYRRKL